MTNYKNLAQLQTDTLAWERDLPYYDGFVGIPRSGMLPATLLALRRNVRLIDLEEFISDPAKGVQLARLRSNNPAIKKPLVNRVLVVDDCTGEQSATINLIRERMPKSRIEVHYGAVYRASPLSAVDCFYKDLPLPRYFEWNWFRHRKLDRTLLDIDGVVCEDWDRTKLGQEQDGDPSVQKYFANAKPLYIPEYPVLGFVTSRLPRYRKVTENWLARYSCRWKHFRLSPFKTADERRKAGGHGLIKGRAYLDITEAELFIESDHKQACTIAEVSGKPVLSIEKQEMLNP
jgi:uncharacterized HAD superfamily protein